MAAHSTHKSAFTSGVTRNGRVTAAVLASILGLRGEAVGGAVGTAVLRRLAHRGLGGVSSGPLGLNPSPLLAEVHRAIGPRLWLVLAALVRARRLGRLRRRLEQRAQLGNSLGWAAW